MAKNDVTLPSNDNQLTSAERKRLTSIETEMDLDAAGFIRFGDYLTEIRDSKLYRENYATFSDYMAQRWQLDRTRGYQLIGANSVIENLKMSTIVDILPKSEGQTRALAKYSAQQQVTIWNTARESLATEQPTAKQLRNVAENLFPRNVETKQQKMSESGTATPESVVIPPQVTQPDSLLSVTDLQNDYIVEPQPDAPQSDASQNNPITNSVITPATVEPESPITNNTASDSDAESYHCEDSIAALSQELYFYTLQRDNAIKAAHDEYDPKIAEVTQKITHIEASQVIPVFNPDPTLDQSADTGDLGEPVARAVLVDTPVPVVIEPDNLAILQELENEIAPVTPIMNTPVTPTFKKHSIVLHDGIRRKVDYVNNDGSINLVAVVGTWRADRVSIEALQAV